MNELQKEALTPQTFGLLHTSPAEAQAASLDLQYPGSLCAWNNVPESIESLRERWFSIHALQYAWFIQSQSGYKMSEQAAKDYVSAKVEPKLPNCTATNISEMHEFVYQCLFPDSFFSVPLPQSRAAYAGE